MTGKGKNVFLVLEFVTSICSKFPLRVCVVFVSSVPYYKAW